MCRRLNFDENYEYLSRPDIDGAKYSQNGVRFDPTGKELNCECVDEEILELPDEAQAIEEELNQQEETPPKWLCDFCDFEAKSRRGLEIHVNAKHKDILLGDTGGLDS